VLNRLGKVTGPVVALLGDTREGYSGIFAAAGAFLQNLSDADVAYFCDELAKYTMVCINGEQFELSRIFDEHFVGEYAAMVEWLAFALEANFAGFFRDLRARVGARMAAVTSASTSPVTSIGSSFGSQRTPGVA